jgi:hypothetical protein
MSYLSHAITFSVGVSSKVFGTWFAQWFQESLLPRLVDKTTPSTNIGGKWIAECIGQPMDGLGLKAEWKLQINLVKKGQVIIGDASSECLSGSGKGRYVDYHVSGKFSDGILNVTLHGTGKDGRNHMTFLMQLVGEGNMFEGCQLFLGRDSNKIRAIKSKWSRCNKPESACGTG